MKKLFPLLSLIVLQACVSTYGSGTPNGVNVYTSAFSNSKTSMDEASKHCAKFNKKAVLVDSHYIPSKDVYKCQ